MNATKFLEKYWDGTLPVDIEKLAKLAGIEVNPVSSAELQGASGCVTIDNENSVVIKYSKDEPKVRQRFVIAHEIGHIILGHLRNGDTLVDRVSNFSTEVFDNREIEANRFAVRVLMPKEVVLYLFERTDYSLEEVADILGVSQVALRHRLIDLGILSYLME